MEKNGDKRFGFFEGQMEVQDKIEELKREGYRSDNMYVIAKDNEQINALRTHSDVHFSTEQDGDWIDKFKQMFSGNLSLKNVFEEMGFSRSEAEEFNRRIENGEIFLYADDEAFIDSDSNRQSSGEENAFEQDNSFPGSDEVAGSGSISASDRSFTDGDEYTENDRLPDSAVAGAAHDRGSDYEEPMKMSRKERRKQISGNEEESLLLHEERLEVHKERVQTGEINVNKRIVEEQQEMDVPLERDDVMVERRPVADNGNPDGEVQKEPYQIGDELHIPVVEERLVVTKKEVVTEEIVVTRKKISDTEHVSETLRREEVDIDESDLSDRDRDKL